MFRHLIAAGLLFALPTVPAATADDLLPPPPFHAAYQRVLDGKTLKVDLSLCALSGDGKQAYAIGWDAAAKRFRLYALAAGQKPLEVPLPADLKSVKDLVTTGDGTEAFFSDDSPPRSVYRVAGGKVGRVFNAADHREVDDCRFLQVTRDGKCLYFSEERGDVWRIDADGGGLQKVVDSTAVKYAGGHARNVDSFAISSDGAVVAFVVSRYVKAKTDFHPEVFVQDGTDLRQLTTDEKAFYKVQLRLSADGSTAVYQAHAPQNQWRAVSLSDGSNRPVAALNSNFSGAGLTADGRQLFLSDMRTQGGRLLFLAGGTDDQGYPRGLSLFPSNLQVGASFDPKISADGRHLTFVSGPVGERSVYLGTLNPTEPIAGLPAIRGVAFTPPTFPRDDPKGRVLVEATIENAERVSLDHIIDGWRQGGFDNLPVLFSDLADNGQGPDKTAKDGVYTAFGKPAKKVKELGRLVVRVAAADRNGNVVVADRVLGIGDRSPIPVEGTAVAGRVRDAGGKPLAGVRVAVGEKNALSDEQGYFALTDIEPAERVRVTLTKDGYVTGHETVNIVKDRRTVIDVVLQVVSRTETIRTDKPQTITDQREDGLNATLEIPADSLVDAEGKPVAEAVVEVTTFLPEDPGFQQHFPGEFAGVPEGKTDPEPFRSFGYVEEVLKDKAGNKVFLKKGSKAVIRFPIGKHDPNTPTIPLWYFDETKGRWYQDGVARRDATAKPIAYVGEVTHIGRTWNIDELIGGRTRKIIQVLSTGGQPIPNVVVQLRAASYSATAGTNATGLTTGMSVRPTDQVRVRVTTTTGQPLSGWWRMIMPPEGQTRTNTIFALTPAQAGPPGVAATVLTGPLRAADVDRYFGVSKIAVSATPATVTLQGGYALVDWVKYDAGDESEVYNFAPATVGPDGSVTGVTYRMKDETWRGKWKATREGLDYVLVGNPDAAKEKAKDIAAGRYYVPVWLLKRDTSIGLLGILP